jgi:hypothetical protein
MWLRYSCTIEDRGSLISDELPARMNPHASVTMSFAEKLSYLDLHAFRSTSENSEHVRSQKI